MEDVTAAPPAERTLDLAELARIQLGERVRVGKVRDRTAELFERTLKILPADGSARPEAHVELNDQRKDRFLPDNQDLRKLYLFAEALGGYEALDDLISAYSPGNTLSRKFEKVARQDTLTPEEVRMLEDYHTEITEALKNANEFLSEEVIQQFTLEEIQELQELLMMASDRAQEITRIIGTHLIKQIDTAVQRLHGYMRKIRTVERTVSGIFLVDSEVMFIPPKDLIECVNTIFQGVGNPYLADNVDGVMLLAARNLLIEVVSFYSYYGKHQIYTLFQKGGASVSLTGITQRIRNEIRQLFRACKAGNKLVLTRVMENAERDFELSVEAIQNAAEESAVAAVKVFIPAEEVKLPKKKNWLGKLFSWFRPRR